MNFKRISSWTEEAEDALGDLLLNDCVKQEVLRFITSGRSILWRISFNEKITWLLASIEGEETDAPVFVLDAIRGSHCAEILEVLKVHCKKSGFTKIRYETHHSEALAERFTGNAGFKRVATILECEL